MMALSREKRPLQEFGHGDRIMLDFVLSRHRDTPADIAEFGTFGGVTSLYLGIAAALRGGRLDTFDIVDNREARVRETFLPNMHFHLGDANAFGADVVRALEHAGVVLVDHVERLPFFKRAAPHLRADCVVLVHDYGPQQPCEQNSENYGSDEEWEQVAQSTGLTREYVEMQRVLESKLAAFIPVVMVPG